VDDLVAKVLAAIEAKEAKAGAATPGPWKAEGDDLTDDEVYSVHDGEHGDLVGDVVAYARGEHGRQVSNMVHIADNDPVDVLRRCAKDREIVAEHSTPWTAAYEGTVCNVCLDGWPCKTMRLLAEGYGIEVK
jgi:hypothetical protein